MKPLNDKEWNEFQAFVKEIDKKGYKNTLGVNFYVCKIIIKREIKNE